MQYLQFFHCNSGYANTVQCYVVRIMRVLFCRDTLDEWLPHTRRTSPDYQNFNIVKLNKLKWTFIIIIIIITIIKTVRHAVFRRIMVGICTSNEFHQWETWECGSVHTVCQYDSVWQTRPRESHQHHEVSTDSSTWFLSAMIMALWVVKFLATLMEYQNAVLQRRFKETRWSVINP